MKSFCTNLKYQLFYVEEPKIKCVIHWPDVWLIYLHNQRNYLQDIKRRTFIFIRISDFIDLEWIFKICANIIITLLPLFRSKRCSIFKYSCNESISGWPSNLSLHNCSKIDFVNRFFFLHSHMCLKILL